jgi:hypothetical protein
MARELLIYRDVQKIWLPSHSRSPQINHGNEALKELSPFERFLCIRQAKKPAISDQMNDGCSRSSDLHSFRTRKHVGDANEHEDNPFFFPGAERAYGGMVSHTLQSMGNYKAAPCDDCPRRI